MARAGAAAVEDHLHTGILLHKRFVQGGADIGHGGGAAMVRVPVSLVSEEPSGFGRGGAADLTGTASGEHRGDQGGRSHRAKNLFIIVLLRCLSFL